MSFFVKIGKGASGLVVRAGSGIKRYVLTLYDDYSSVLKDAALDVRKKPWKGILTAGAVGIICYAVKTNPDENQFSTFLVENRLRLLQLGDVVRNPVSTAFVHDMTDYANRGLIRRANLILFSLIWHADYPPGCDLYSANCKQLKPKWSEFGQRILDVGAFGRWYKLRTAMRDYDVNENEFLRR